MSPHTGPDMRGLRGLAHSQGGYFSSAQAAGYGVSPALCAYHVKTGLLQRLRRGLYRFRGHPASPEGSLHAALLVLGHGVISHQSALFLHGLLAAPPPLIDVTVDRQKRRKAPLGVRLHTRTVGLVPAEIELVGDLPVTAVTRSIVDAASVGLAAEVIRSAVARSLARGMTDPTRLLFAADEAGPGAHTSVRRALSSVV